MRNLESRCQAEIQGWTELKPVLPEQQRRIDQANIFLSSQMIRREASASTETLRRDTFFAMIDA